MRLALAIAVLLLARCAAPASKLASPGSQAGSASAAQATKASSSSTRTPAPHPSSATGTSSGSPSSSSATAAASNASSSGGSVVPRLADAWLNFTNPVPAPAPNGIEKVVASFVVPAGLQQLQANFTRHHASVEFFADNCRLYRGRDFQTQDAFSDAQYGNVDSTGTCDLAVDSPEAGDWTAVYLTDGLDPKGTHEVHVVVTAS